MALNQASGLNLGDFVGAVTCFSQNFFRMFAGGCGGCFDAAAAVGEAKAGADQVQGAEGAFHGLQDVAVLQLGVLDRLGDIADLAGGGTCFGQSRLPRGDSVAGKGCLDNLPQGCFMFGPAMPIPEAWIVH